jgi:hypothetical protein
MHGGNPKFEAVVGLTHQTTYAFVTMINNVNSFLRAQND